MKKLLATLVAATVAFSAVAASASTLWVENHAANQVYVFEKLLTNSVDEYGEEYASWKRHTIPHYLKGNRFDRDTEYYIEINGKRVGEYDLRETGNVSVEVWGWIFGGDIRDSLGNHVGW